MTEVEIQVEVYPFVGPQLVRVQAYLILRLHLAPSCGRLHLMLLGVETHKVSVYEFLSKGSAALQCSGCILELVLFISLRTLLHYVCESD